MLQTHRRLRSSELASDLGVTERTVRRDIDRLRGLGYPVDATPGVEGGYQLAAGSDLPPLMLNDDEAVALAVGLWSATSAPVEGIEETALRALAKLEALLPDRIRRRTNAITSNVSTYRWPRSQREQADVNTILVATAACRDSEEMRFTYLSKAGDETERLVEPHRLVAIDQRWYLLAWDSRREDWRTFRLDRMTNARLAGVRFNQRPIPGGDPAAFVASNLGGNQSITVTLRVATTLQELHDRVPWYADETASEVGGFVEFEMKVSGIGQATGQIAQLAMVYDLEIVDGGPETDEIRSRLTETAGRLAAI